MIKLDWEELKNPEEIAIIQKYANKSKNYTIVLSVIFIGFCLMITLSYFLPRLLDIVVPLNETRKPKVIIPIETFYKIEKNIYGLVFLIIIIAILGIAAVAVYGSFFTFSSTYLWNVKSHGDVLTEHQWDIINYTKFIDFLKDASEECYTIQLTLALVLIASDYIKLMQINKDKLRENIDDVTVCLVHVIGIMFSVFINCHAGQQIIDHCNYVFQKAKTAPWYLVSTKIQKLAIMILMRSQKTCYLGVGGTFVSSYEFFLLFKMLIEQISSDWTKLRSEEEFKIFQKYAKESRLGTFVFLSEI
ncbi:hypothetical protein M0802_006870 [Mischocyttarus mexicanus]|nr:hypothetical protein M0802_006870 [Mischocyttarus mexicanus]